MNIALKPTEADEAIRLCLEENRSFYVIAGAGSGKTTSLIAALDHIRDKHGKRLRRDVQRVVCVTYTKRAVAVISSKLGWDELFLVSTLHSFLWEEIRRYTTDIRRALKDGVLPAHIEKKRKDDNGGKSQKALAAREDIAELERHIANLANVPSFSYGDSSFSDYATGELGHDDIIELASQMISTSEQLRRIIGQKYPYIFVDEAQDTHESVVSAFNSICENSELPIVGYFGDPMQQIYDKRAGDFKGPPDSLRIPKEENFRCSRSVVDLLNAFRSDIQQFPAGANAEIEGSVVLRLIQAEAPQAAYGQYTQEQADRASKRLDQALAEWGWTDRGNTKHLYLVRQMIARRLNFSNLHNLFTGKYISARGKDDYEKGEHFLLTPFITSLCPLVRAHRLRNERAIIDILRRSSPAFDPEGVNSKKTLMKMRALADSLIAELSATWGSGSIGDILQFSRRAEICKFPKRLTEHLSRAPRGEDYVEDMHSMHKSDWLADEFFKMRPVEIENFCEFISENTIFSTQHGVKGEQYDGVLVVFDDVGSAWNNYSFSKTLTPDTAGAQPTDRQLRLSKNLAYVCFSRAERDLRIVMFSSNPTSARKELLKQKFFTEDQIEIS